MKSGPICALDKHCWHAKEDLTPAQIEGIELLFGRCVRPES